jgi:hypothetical protein
VNFAHRFVSKAAFEEKCGSICLNVCSNVGAGNKGGNPSLFRGIWKNYGAVNTWKKTAASIIKPSSDTVIFGQKLIRDWGTLERLSHMQSRPFSDIGIFNPSAQILFTTDFAINIEADCRKPCAVRANESFAQRCIGVECDVREEQSGYRNPVYKFEWGQQIAKKSLHTIWLLLFIAIVGFYWQPPMAAPKISAFARLLYRNWVLSELGQVRMELRTTAVGA